MARQDTPTESFSVVVTASARLGASSVDDSVRSALTHFLEQSKAYDGQLEFSFVTDTASAAIKKCLDKIEAASYHRNYRQACIDIQAILLAEKS